MSQWPDGYPVTAASALEYSYNANANQRNIHSFGRCEHRVLEVLKVAKHQVRVAQGGATPRMQDALVGLEDALSDQIAWLENAAEDDKADAEDFGEAEPERHAYHPPKAA
jgi:hypothetical protein